MSVGVNLYLSKVAVIVDWDPQRLVGNLDQ